MDEAKKSRRLSAVAGRHTKLAKRGEFRWKGLCPFHRERSPSFEVDDAKGLFHCYGCGKGGDHFTILTELDGHSFPQAYEALTNETFPSVSPEEMARAAEEDAVSRAAAIEEARGFWSMAGEVPGTPAERYLRQARGITAPPPASLRFGIVPLSRFKDGPHEGEWRPPLPALLAAATIGDEFAAMQRVFLRANGSDKLWAKPRKSKFTMGRLVGAAVKMGRRRTEPDEIVVTEGLEDAVSLAQELPEAEVWAALGTANLSRLILPSSVRSIILAGQNDDAGRNAIDEASQAYLAAGLRVRAMWPGDGFKDWNDMLRGVRA